MPPSGRPVLGELLAAITEDAIFGIAAAAEPDEDTLRGLAKRRASAYAEIAKGVASRTGVESFTIWVLELCAAIAPVHPPVWMPMADAVKAGLSLEGGARGVRSLFTSKPSDKDVERVKRHGTLAVRVLTAINEADGGVTADEKEHRLALVTSLGLDATDARALADEPPMAPDALDVGDLDGKLAKAILRGAWLAAAGDGIDPREESTLRTIAVRMRLAGEDVEAARTAALASIDARRDVGAASVDAIRYVLGDDPAAAAPLTRVPLDLVLAPVHRAEAQAALAQAAPVALAGRHRLERSGKATALALAWLAALRTDPALTRRIELVARHEAVAADLGAGSAGSAMREMLDKLVEGELLTAARAAGL